MGSCIPDSHPHRMTNTICRTDIVFSSDDGHIVSPKHVAKKTINILGKMCTNLVLFTGYIELC
jgi:hypothetical protein